MLLLGAKDKPPLLYVVSNPTFAVHRSRLCISAWPAEVRPLRPVWQLLACGGPKSTLKRGYPGTLYFCLRPSAAFVKSLPNPRSENISREKRAY